MAASSAFGAEGFLDAGWQVKSGPEQTFYMCNSCQSGISGARFRCLKCASEGRIYDWCGGCFRAAAPLPGHEAGHEVKQFAPGFVDLEEVKRGCPFPLDVALSVGHNIRRILTFAPQPSSSSSSDDDNDDNDDNNGGESQPKSVMTSPAIEDYHIEFLDVMTQAKDPRGPFEVEGKDVASICKVFGVATAKEVEGKTVASRFRAGRDLVQELVLAGRHGLYSTPGRSHLEGRLVAAFKALQAPDFSDIHPSYVHDYFLSLFSESFEYPDPVHALWFSRVGAALHDQGSDVVVLPAEADAFLRPPNELQMLLARVASSNAKAGDPYLLVCIVPASNGLFIESRTI